VCWRNVDRCVQRETYELTPSFEIYQPTHGTVNVPTILGLNTDMKNAFTDQYRDNSILARDGFNAAILNYNHTFLGRGTAESLLSHLLVVAADQTENVNVVWAIWGEASALGGGEADGNKVVSDVDIRARATASGQPIPTTWRLLSSQRLQTTARTPNYYITETKLWYYSPLGFTDTCVGSMGPIPGAPPFTYEGFCNYSNGIVVNPSKNVLPGAGKFLVTLYEDRGRPVPYILSTGAHSFLNYVPIPGFYTPSGQFVTFDFFNLARNYEALLSIGSRVLKGFDLQEQFDLFVGAKK
jgi:hypothetical protein